MARLPLNEATVRHEPDPASNHRPVNRGYAEQALQEACIKVEHESSANADKRSFDSDIQTAQDRISPRSMKSGVFLRRATASAMTERASGTKDTHSTVFQP